MLYDHMCAQCAQPFTNNHPTQRYCSQPCRTAATVARQTNTRFHYRVKQHTTIAPRANWRGWTDAEITIVRQMAGHATSFQIAERLGRSHHSVKHMARTYGLSLRLYGEKTPWCKYPDAIVEEARVLHESGMKPKDIAAHLNLPYWSVCDFVYYKRGLGYALVH